MNDQLSALLDQLIDARFAGTELTPEVREEAKKDVLDRLNAFLLERTIDAFSDEDTQTFSQMMTDKKSIEELQQFAASHIPNYQEFMVNTLREFQEGYLS